MCLFDLLRFEVIWLLRLIPCRGAGRRRIVLNIELNAACVVGAISVSGNARTGRKDPTIGEIL